ncbi:phosphoribosyltransferase, partial [Pseudomonas syringae pv. pisi str. 1704B]
DLPRPDCLIPVPLAIKRLRQRGYNQAAMLAGWLGKQLQLPVDEEHVLRSRETTAQQGLDAKARKRNLRGIVSYDLQNNLNTAKTLEHPEYGM